MASFEYETTEDGCMRAYDVERLWFKHPAGFRTTGKDAAELVISSNVLPAEMTRHINSCVHCGGAIVAYAGFPKPMDFEQPPQAGVVVPVEAPLYQS